MRLGEIRPVEIGRQRLALVGDGDERGLLSFFQTSIEFRPTLQAQHDDAESKGQQHRATLFGQLLNGLTKGEASCRARHGSRA